MAPEFEEAWKERKVLFRPYGASGDGKLEEQEKWSNGRVTKLRRARHKENTGQRVLVVNQPASPLPASEMAVCSCKLPVEQRKRWWQMCIGKER
jgi:hypothetical protein